ncbi:MAG: NAD synthetase [Bacteroidota bacterium]|jgi:hypothetical protein
MKLWQYQDRPITCIEDFQGYNGLFGFVYLIHNTMNGQFYVGKKVFRNNRKKKITQKVKKATGTRKTYERTITESDWKDYYGSSKELSADIQRYGKDKFKRTILELCCTKKYLSYAEVAWQIKLDVLRTNSYNGNILGRYYTRDMQNCL